MRTLRPLAPTVPLRPLPTTTPPASCRRHPEQGWSLLCNGVVVFDDTGEILPDGRTVAPHRPICRVWVAA